ncbi:condensation domain-containing protein [Micromonosporaceae bacterium B7E4]
MALARTAPLTWGQQGIWTAIERNPPAQFNVGVALSVPFRYHADVSTLVTAVGMLISQHQALRTRILSVDGGLRQVVEGAGTPEVEVVEAAEEEVPRLVHQLRARPFDYARGDLPVRAVLARDGGAVRYVLLAFCHMAVDLFALSIVCRDLLALIAGDPLPPPGPQPADLAHRQRTPAGQRRTASAVAYWSTRLRELEAPMFAGADSAAPAKFRSALLVSPAAGAAARLLSERHGVGDGVVLQHACVSLLRRVTGHRICHLKIFTNNRFWPEHDRVVATLSQSGLFVSDQARETPFDEALRHTARAAVLAHRHAYYDQYELDGALDRLRQDLRGGVRLDSYFNDARSAGPQIWTGTSHPTFDPEPDVAVDVTDPAAIRKATASTSFGWLADPAWMRCNFSMRIFGAPAAPRFSLSANTQLFPVREMEQFLLDLESLLVEAVA